MSKLYNSLVKETFGLLFKFAVGSVLWTGVCWLLYYFISEELTNLQKPEYFIIKLFLIVFCLAYNIKGVIQIFKWVNV